MWWLRAELLHPLPSLATTIAAIAFALLLGLPLTDVRFYAIAAIVLMSQVSISALNDWADRDRDAVTDRWRPIPLGALHPSTALAVASIFGIGTLIATVPFGLAALGVMSLGLAAGWAYDLWLKPTVLSFVPFAIAFPLLPIWIGLVERLPISGFRWLAVAGIFLGIAIHLADSLPDIGVDARAGVRSLSVVFGPTPSLSLMLGCIVAGALFTVLGLPSHSLLAGVVAVAALAAGGLTAWIGRRQMHYDRWIVAGFALIAAVALLIAIGHDRPH